MTPSLGDKIIVVREDAEIIVEAQLPCFVD
jgi:hypothetical protein